MFHFVIVLVMLISILIRFTKNILINLSLIKRLIYFFSSTDNTFGVFLIHAIFEVVFIKKKQGIEN